MSNGNPPASVTHLVFTADLPAGERFRVVPGGRVVFVSSSTRHQKPQASSPRPIGLLATNPLLPVARSAR